MPTGALLSEALRAAGLDIGMPCGGQGRCGRCAVIASASPPRSAEGAGERNPALRRRSTLRLSPDDLAAGYALACQTIVEGDAVVTIPPQEKLERRLLTDRTARRVALPFVYDAAAQQPLRLVDLVLDPPSVADQTDDWSRLKRAVAPASVGQTSGLDPDLEIDLSTLRGLGAALRENDWAVTLVIEQDTWDRPSGPPRLVAVLPAGARGLYGAAIDIGTTTVSLYLVDLLSGEVLKKEAEYNAQIKRGEDVISRIIYASKADNGGLIELQGLVVGTINELLAQAARAARIRPDQIYKLTVAGNSTMIHLLLALPPGSIRREPFVTAANAPPPVRARELGLLAHPEATVDCLPGVASYIGADITAGVVGTQLCAEPTLTVFLDVGTNGEMVLSDGDWMVSCACSAGPAFEGGGVQDGMRATSGAIEEVWVSSQTYEPTYRVIPDPKLEARGTPTPPRGLCGSGLISLLAELFLTGAIDKGGNLNFHLDSSRIRQGEHGPEYVVAWGSSTAHGRDIVLTRVDISNLMRAKGAIYAGLTMLAESVGLDLALIERMLIGGSFGQYINVEKAIQIGLLPDLPWDKFQFLGNTALHGTLLALLHRDCRRQVVDVAARLTYLELSADNRFYEQFMSALFLPHTDVARFPSVLETVS